jgi:monofunctional biosynthetic peptidoglycan transglycosylase
MEVYLNSIEMGDGIYGVDACAKYNFGKTAADLTRGDCALIAATLPNPRRFSSKNPSGYMRLRQRQIQANMSSSPRFRKKAKTTTLILLWEEPINNVDDAEEKRRLSSAF